jgi:thiosulfate dehydrogenase
VSGFHFFRNPCYTVFAYFYQAPIGPRKNLKETGNKEEPALQKTVDLLVNLVVILLLVIAGLVVTLVHYVPEPTARRDVDALTPDSNGLFTEAARLALATGKKDTTRYWSPPDLAGIRDSTLKELVSYGRELVEHTGRYYGPSGRISSQANGMNCQNCHLEGGTKIFGNNYSAVFATYPKYRGRSGSLESIEKRISDCFQRSLNGKSPPPESKEMRAIKGYITWLGNTATKGNPPDGAGLKKIAFLDRAADPARGEHVYTGKCARCHGKDGEGKTDSLGPGFRYPPLWGNHSYNVGAGLYRVHTFARFVKYNMPEGSSHLAPQLSDEEAWDVAAFVNSRPRPVMNLAKDWPRIAEKPIDHPFGPYADSFSEARHKYGPYSDMLKNQDQLAKNSAK